MVEALGELLLNRNDPALLMATGHKFLETMIAGKNHVRFEQHVLGFWHAALGETESGIVRCHLWPPKITPRAPAWTIHSHRFQLDSFVLAGSVTNKDYAVTDSNEGLFRVYEVVYDNSWSYRRKSERIVNCTERRSTLLGGGDFYRVPRGEFHSTVTSSTASAVTFVLTRNQAEEFPLVVGALSGAELYKYERVFVGEDEVDSLVRQVLSQPNFRGDLFPRFGLDR